MRACGGRAIIICEHENKHRPAQARSLAVGSAAFSRSLRVWGCVSGLQHFNKLPTTPTTAKELCSADPSTFTGSEVRFPRAIRRAPPVSEPLDDAVGVLFWPACGSRRR